MPQSSANSVAKGIEPANTGKGRASGTSPAPDMPLQRDAITVEARTLSASSMPAVHQPSEAIEADEKKKPLWFWLTLAGLVVAAGAAIAVVLSIG